MISMIAPTSHDRIKMIAAEAKGFVYCVSSLGVTGVRSEITTDIGAMVRLVKEANPDIPCAVGFGISTPAQAEKWQLYRMVLFWAVPLFVCVRSTDGRQQGRSESMYAA